MHTEAMEVEARTQFDKVHNLQGQAKALQTKLAGSRTMMMELERRVMDLEVALVMEREKTTCLVERAQSIMEAVCLEGQAQTL